VVGGVVGGVVGSVGSAQEAPKLLPPNVATAQCQQAKDSNPPQYTPAAKQAHFEGSMMAKICIGADGGVTSISILKGLPLGLNEAVQTAVRRWRCKPFQMNGRAMPFCYVAAFNFKLQ